MSTQKYYYPVAVPSLLTADETIEMDDWLWSEIGEEVDDWELTKFFDYILFNSAEDAMAFKLRWT